MTVTGAFGPSLLIRDFATGHSTWGVTSQFPTFVSHCSSAFLWVIRLMVLETQEVLFYMLDPGLFATVSLTFAYVLAYFPHQACPY
jgi:hypothetical protein